MTSSRRLRIAPTPRPEQSIRVLYLIDSLGPGGAERLMVDLLPRLRDHGIDSTVVAIQERHGNPMADALRAVGIPVSTIGIERLRERGALARVVQAVEDAAPHVIHTQLEFADILGSIAGSRLDIPTIATIHTLDRPRRYSKAALHFRLMAWSLRRRSNRIVAVSESAREHVLHKAGLPRRRTVTIHNGIDLEPYLVRSDEERARTRDALGLGEHTFVVATVAVLRPAKGIDDMIEALPALSRLHPDLHYLVVGDGEHRAALEAHARRADVDHIAHFVGHRSDVSALLQASDVFVLPSHTEALPTVLIEAMAAGLPVVATEVGGVLEIVDHGTTGLVVPPAAPERLTDAVDRLARSPRQRAAMGQAGQRSAVDRFDIARQASRLADEYRVLLSRAGAA